MTITLQGYLHREPIFITPETDEVICQDCSKEYIIKGNERIELDYDNVLDMEAVEEILEETMEKLGWVNKVCPSCMESRKKHSR